MTEAGRPRLNRIAGPLLGEFTLGMSVAMVCLWLASRSSDAAAGAFGLSGQVLETLFVLFRVLAIGVSVVVTQALGAGQNQTAERTARAVLGASTWVGLLAAASVLLGDTLMLEWLRAPEAVRPLAGPLLQLLAPALLLEAYNLCLAAILRAHLQAQACLRVMLLMHGTHLLLALPLMQTLGLPGYALAMLVSRALGLAVHLWLWRRALGLPPRWRDFWVLRLPVLWPVLRIGLPGAGTEMVYRLAFMVSLAATAALGVSALATHSYTLQLLKYVVLISLAIGWACEIMVGRLVGAGDFRAANALVRKAARNGLAASGGLALLAALGAPWLLSLFTRDPEVVAAAQTLLWLSLALETGRVFNIIVAGALRATGDAVFPALASVGSMALVLGAGSVWLGKLFGLPGIWVAYALDEWLRGLLMLGRWLVHGWLPHARDSQRRQRTPR